MRLFFVNTDAVSFAGLSRHDEWLRRGVVITGGEAKYKESLARIPDGARALVYVNKLGVVAVGQVTSKEAIEVMPPDTVYPTDQPEYHRPVNWLLDLRDSPITWGTLRALLGQGPLNAVQEVLNGKEALLRHLANLEADRATDADSYLRVASELRRLGAVDRPLGAQEPLRTECLAGQYIRDARVRAWTLQRAKDHCELCLQPAPFLDGNQELYLESHHITMLAAGGSDTPENTAALCANCHRELHHGADRQAKTEKLRALIRAKEGVSLVATGNGAG